MNVLTTLVLLFATTNAASGDQSPVSGTIVDSMGAVIPNSYVLIRTDAREREHPVSVERTSRTNKNGEFKLSLDPGFYDIFVSANGFAPYCRNIRVRDGKPLKLRIPLSIDQLMLQEYGDEFREP